MEVFVGSLGINSVVSDVFVIFVIIFFYRVYIKDIMCIIWYFGRNGWFNFGEFVIIWRVIVGFVSNVRCWVVFGNV